MALRVMLVRVRVEGCIIRNREFGKGKCLADINDLSTIAISAEEID